MPRSMVHPMWGNLVVCAELTGAQHDANHPGHLEMCDHCGRPILCCEPCKSIINCCKCGERHALECPWPL